ASRIRSQIAIADIWTPNYEQEGPDRLGDERDTSIYAGSHNILHGCSIEAEDGYKSFGLKTDLPTIKC
ncbi:MAG: hypothetical protein IKH39_06320, partial [Candidatus Methanomethylophilaceae archaeon]|nr:hypothetical protein [Candidatus Methanomethylophilaceae archaeon]